MYPFESGYMIIKTVDAITIFWWNCCGCNPVICVSVQTVKKFCTLGSCWKRKKHKFLECFCRIAASQHLPASNDMLMAVYTFYVPNLITTVQLIWYFHHICMGFPQFIDSWAQMFGFLVWIKEKSAPLEIEIHVIEFWGFSILFQRWPTFVRLDGGKRSVNFFWVVSNRAVAHAGRKLG